MMADSSEQIIQHLIDDNTAMREAVTAANGDRQWLSARIRELEKQIADVPWWHLSASAVAEYWQRLGDAADDKKAAFVDPAVSSATAKPLPEATYRGLCRDGGGFDLYQHPIHPL